MRKILWIVFVVIILANGVAYIHAYKFTHFSATDNARTKDAKDLSHFDKVKLLFTGIDNPKPIHKSLPALPYETIQIKSDETLEGWYLAAPQAKGTVILFHGYAGEKSSLLTRAEVFLKSGYNTLLIDFMGSGGSTGNGTSIGYAEATQVKDCFEYAASQGEEKVILFGTSMGAAAILKAADDYNIAPAAIILECPFGSLYKTVCARFELMGIPSFPMAALLSFWGGLQNGYWAFAHNPTTYAQSVTVPTLLLFGAQDDRVTHEETNAIYNNLKGPKTLKVYPNEGHNIFTKHNQRQWTADVNKFLNNHP